MKEAYNLKVAVSSEKQNLNALLDHRFGRCSYFLIVKITLKYYYNNSELVTAGEKWMEKIPQDLLRKVNKQKGSSPKEFNELRLVVATQPAKSGMRKKKPEVFEISVGGDDIKKKAEYCESLLGKEIAAKDIFKPGEFVDVAAVTKGYGFTGPVKRFGIRLQRRKDQQMHRHVGSIASTVPRHIDWRTPIAGQYGFFTRTEVSKKILMIDDDSKKVNPKGGFIGYGLVNSFPNKYLYQCAFTDCLSMGINFRIDREEDSFCNSL